MLLFRRRLGYRNSYMTLVCITCYYVSHMTIEIKSTDNLSNIFESSASTILKMISALVAMTHVKTVLDIRTFAFQKQQALAALNTQALTLTEAFKKQQMSAWLQKNQLQDVLQPAMLLNVLLGAQSENQVMVLVLQLFNFVSWINCTALWFASKFFAPRVFDCTDFNSLLMILPGTKWFC